MAKKKSNCKKCLPDWLAQFGDLMSLLLVFFILLLSMSVLDEKKVIEYLAHMKQSLGVMANAELSQVVTIKEVNRTTEMEKTADDTQQTMNEITESIIELNQRTKYNKEIENEEMDIEDFAILELGKSGFIIKLPIDIVFEDGKYEVSNKEMDIFLTNVYKIIKNKPFEIELLITGYSSDSEIPYLNTLLHPKNLWELGFFRAESVALSLIDKGFDKNKIKISSNGKNNKKTYKNKSKNNRVEIEIISKKFESELNKDRKDFFIKNRKK
jgi:chemotaxis protein MotB